jgi:hypothetical protein
VFIFVALIFIIIWAVGLLILPQAGIAIHVMLVAAAISIGAHFLSGRLRADR